jgi:hypothetical protein
MNLVPPLPFSQSNLKTKTDRNQGAAAASIEIEAQQMGNKDRVLYLAPPFPPGLHWSPGQFGGVQVESRYNLFCW